MQKQQAVCRVRAKVRCIRRWELIPMRIMAIPFPYRLFPTPSHSHSQFCHQFPFPWESHGIPIPIGNPIPMVISTVNTYRSTSLATAYSSEIKIGDILFSKVDSNKLRFNVKNEITLICAEFGADLINACKVKPTSRKTKWPRFFGLRFKCLIKLQNALLICH